MITNGIDNYIYLAPYKLMEGGVNMRIDILTNQEMSQINGGKWVLTEYGWIWIDEGKQPSEP